MSITTSTIGPRFRLSPRATALFAAATAVAFSASSSAPTPLYHLYQETLGLSAPAITLVFAVYAFAMLAAFLTVARLSDHLGRRPMILVALLLNVASCIVFGLADSFAHLILARIVQGLATGIALTTLGAAIVDSDPQNGALLNSVTAFIGLTVGSLLAGVLVTWAPWPAQLVYWVLLAVCLMAILMLAVMPETATVQPGALGALVPRVRVPAAARAAMLRLMPLNLAGWALGGFYLSLMPSVVAAATGSRSVFVGASVVSTLMLTASVTVFALRGLTPEALVHMAGLFLSVGIGLTLLAIEWQSAVGILAGAVVVGVGFGSTYSGILRSLLPLAGAHERAGLLSAYFVASYLSFALPAVLAGVMAPRLGLITTSLAYGGTLALLALASLAMQRR